MRGTLLLVTAVVIGALAGCDRAREGGGGDRAGRHRSLVARADGHARAVSSRPPAASSSLVKLQLDRANAIIENSAKYQIPADLAADIYDIALSEGIDPALGFQLVKVESSFKATRASSMHGVGYTQLQVPTARFYRPRVTERDLYDRETNLRIGFRFLKTCWSSSTTTCTWPCWPITAGRQVANILATGGNPANGYSDAC